MKKTMWAPALAFLAVLLVPAGPAPSAQVPGQEISYVLDLTRAAEGEVGVTLRAASPNGGLSLKMEESFGKGLAVNLPSHVEDLRATDGGGAELPISREGGNIRVEGSGQVIVSYRVRLTGYQAGTPYLQSLADSGPPWPYFPRADSSLAYLPGYAVLMYPEGQEEAPAELRLVMPSGWESLPAGEGSPLTVRAILTDPILAGELHVHWEGSFRLVFPAYTSPPPGTVRELASRMALVLDRSRALPGTEDHGAGDALTFFFLQGGEGDLLEDAFYPLESFSRTVVIPMPSKADVLSDACLETAVRGAVRLLLSRSLRLKAEAAWLVEGASWYLQGLLAYEAGIWGNALFWDRLSSRYDRYRQARASEDMSLAEAGEKAALSPEAATLLSCGGAAACAAIDAELRSRPFAGELPSFLHELSGLSAGEEGLGNAEISSFLERRTGRTWSSFFGDHVQGGREIPPSYFSALKVAPGEGSALPEEGSPGSTSLPEWILLAAAVAVVLLIPFVLEPYTMRPRKPGFLDKKLRDYDRS